VVLERRELRQVDLVAGEDELLARRGHAVDEARGDRLRLASHVLEDEVARGRVDRQPDRDGETREARVHVRDDGDARALDVLEDDERVAPLVLESPQDRGDLEDRVDLARDPQHLAGMVLLEVPDEGLEILSRRRPRLD